MCRAGAGEGSTKAWPLGAQPESLGPSEWAVPSSRVTVTDQSFGEMDNSGCRVSLTGWGKATER